MLSVFVIIFKENISPACHIKNRLLTGTMTILLHCFHSQRFIAVNVVLVCLVLLVSVVHVHVFLF